MGKKERKGRNKQKKKTSWKDVEGQSLFLKNFQLHMIPGTIHVIVYIVTEDL